MSSVGVSRSDSGSRPRIHLWLTGEMNLHIVAGVVFIGFGVVDGIVSLRQVVNGTGF